MLLAIAWHNLRQFVKNSIALHLVYIVRWNADTATFYDITGAVRRPKLIRLSVIVLTLAQRVLDVKALSVEVHECTVTDAQLSVIVKHGLKPRRQKLQR
jgi:hypothetical protein